MLSSESKGISCDASVMNNNASEKHSVKVKKDGGIKREKNTNKSFTGSACMERNGQGVEGKKYGNELPFRQSEYISSSSNQNEDTNWVCNVLHVDSNDLQVKWKLDTADNPEVGQYNFKSQESNEDYFPLDTESEEPECVFEESFVDNKELQVVSMGRFYPKEIKAQDAKTQNESSESAKAEEILPHLDDQCEEEVDEGIQNGKLRGKQNEAGSSTKTLNQENSHDTREQEDTEIKNGNNKNTLTEKVSENVGQCEEEVDEGIQNEKTRGKQSDTGFSTNNEHIHTGDASYKCTFCNKEFTLKCNLEVHERIHSGVKPYTCTYCNKGFTVKCNQEKHERIHTGDKPYTCTFCNKGFKQQSHLTQHERIHTGVKPYACTYCEKGFTRQSDRKAHERIHTGIKPYTCTYCTKGFIKQGSLKIHERIHTGFKPYTCTYCNKGFTQPIGLKRHESIHTGVKPYTCTHCNKGFTEQGQLSRHERFHTGVKPYTCTYCNKGFTAKGQLTRHERIHTGVKPYTCIYCKKGFTQQGHLKEHERIHTGVKPYTCTYCKKRFTEKGHLNKHERIHKTR